MIAVKKNQKTRSLTFLVLHAEIIDAVTVIRRTVSNKKTASTQ